jgi:hypothetical protein
VPVPNNAPRKGQRAPEPALVPLAPKGIPVVEWVCGWMEESCRTIASKGLMSELGGR